MLKIILFLFLLGIVDAVFGQESYFLSATASNYNTHSSNLKGNELYFELFRKCNQKAPPILNYDFSEGLFPGFIVSYDQSTEKPVKNKKHKKMLRKVTKPIVRLIKFNKKIIWSGLGIKDRRKEEKTPSLFYYGQWITEGFASHANEQNTRIASIQSLSFLPAYSINESQSPFKNVHLLGIIMNFDINQDNNKLLKHFYQNLNMRTPVRRFINDGFTFTVRLR
ncbi:MAG: hypothetical protein Q8859_08370 [Bacteroidota bacterium]|nr:hypothetical protein [Bacteroidota bacterium]